MNARVVSGLFLGVSFPLAVPAVPLGVRGGFGASPPVSALMIHCALIGCALTGCVLTHCALSSAVTTRAVTGCVGWLTHSLTHSLPH